jgi:hypothetical protein
MTTLSDMLFDFIKEILKEEQDAENDAMTLTDEAIRQKIDTWLDDVKGKLI